MTVAAIYARKSTEDERSAEDGNSIERQREHATTFALKRGWTVAAHAYADDGVSGAEFVNRHGLQQLLRDVRLKPPPFQAVIISEDSRLGREQVETAYVLKQITDAGVEVWTYLDGQRLAMKTSTDKLMFSVKAMASETERERGRQRTRDALVRKARLGHSTGQRVYGYTTRRVNDHAERVVNPTAAAVVRTVFALAAEGLGYGRIVNRLVADGVPAPGKGWARERVARILNNPSYIGRFTYGRSTSVDRGGSVGKRERVPTEAWVTVDLPDLRIVDDALWKRVQARLATTRQHFMRTPDGRLAGRPESGLVATHVLNGIARCGACGGALTFMSNRGRGRYYCGTRLRKPDACSNARGVPAEALDQGVIKHLFDELIGDPARRAALIAENEEIEQRLIADHQAAQPDREREIQRLEAEIGRLVTGLAEGSKSPDIVAAIEDRRAKVTALKVPAPAPVGLKRVLTGWVALMVRINRHHPVAVRQLMRKMGVTSITVTRTTTGWDYEGFMDLGSSAFSSEAPGSPGAATGWDYERDTDLLNSEAPGSTGATMRISLPRYDMPVPWIKPVCMIRPSEMQKVKAPGVTRPLNTDSLATYSMSMNSGSLKPQRLTKPQMSASDTVRPSVS